MGGSEDRGFYLFSCCFSPSLSLVLLSFFPSPSPAPYNRIASQRKVVLDAAALDPVALDPVAMSGWQSYKLLQDGELVADDDDEEARDDGGGDGGLLEGGASCLRGKHSLLRMMKSPVGTLPLFSSSSNACVWPCIALAALLCAVVAILSALWVIPSAGKQQQQQQQREGVLQYVDPLIGTGGGGMLIMISYNTHNTHAYTPLYSSNIYLSGD